MFLKYIYIYIYIVYWLEQWKIKLHLFLCSYISLWMAIYRWNVLEISFLWKFEALENLCAYFGIIKSLETTHVQK